VKIINVIKQALGGGNPGESAGGVLSAGLPASSTQILGPRATKQAETGALMKKLDDATFGVSPEKLALKPPPAPVKPKTWEELYKVPPYFGDSFSPVIRREWVEAVARDYKIDLFTDSERKKLQELTARWEAAQAQLVDIGHRAVQERMIEAIHKNDKLISAGKTPERLPHAPDLHVEFQLRRGQLRGEMHSAGVLAKPIFETIYARIVEACKQAVVKLDAEERAAAQELALPFEPSTRLKALIFLAVRGSEAQIFTPGSFGNPRHALFGCLEK